VVTLDVSALEPPEPLVQALQALRSLPEGACLELVHRMRPVLLYEQAAALGFDADTRQDEAGRCRVYFWRRDDPVAQARARDLAERFAPWRE
jgi:hypothetical protein